MEKLTAEQQAALERALLPLARFLLIICEED